MKLTKSTLDKEKFLALTVPEQSLFFGLAHLSNELNASHKILYWASNSPTNHEIHEDGQYSLMLMLVQIVAGKLHEGWKLFDGYYHGSRLSKTYHPILDSKTLEAITELKKYFSSKNNAATIIRNNFSFHYSPDLASSILPQVENKLKAYTNDEDAPNNLFQFTETILSDALFNCLAEQDINLNLVELAGEFMEVTKWYSDTTDGILFAIIKNNNNDLLRSDPEEIELEDLSPFTDIFIPWFTNTDKLLGK